MGSNVYKGKNYYFSSIPKAGANKKPLMSAGGGAFTGAITFSPDNTYDIGASGATRPRDLFLSRNATVGGSMTVSGGGVTIQASNFFVMSGRSGIGSSADGLLTFVNNAGTSFTRMNLGGTTSSFPAVSVNGAGLEIKLADDSAFTTLKVSALTISSGTFMIASSAALSNGAAAQTATLTNGPTAGNPTKWIPVNDNGTTRYIPAW